MAQYVAPSNTESAFNCPHCGAYAAQAWARMAWGGASVSFMDGFGVSQCQHCAKYGLWVGPALVFPPTSTAPLAHDDMPHDVRADYDEARAIVAVSPRGACALLRLGAQKLCAELGEGGKNINDDIKSMVSKGLLAQVQQALDVLRVVGNNAVHPGEIELKDDQATATGLFAALNMIVEQLIAQPKQIAQMYSALPQGALNQIQTRDGGTGSTP